MNVLSIALGIAVYLAIQIANGSANRSFSAGVDLVAGKSHLEISGQIDETLWPQIARESGVRASTAVIDGVVTLPDFPGEYLKVLGIDLFTNEAFRTFQIENAGQKLDFSQWLATPGGIALSRELADKHSIVPGQKLRALVNSVMKEVVVLAVMEPGDSPAAAQPRFAVMDLGWAQELFGSQGRLSSIQILLDEPGRTPEMAAALKGRLPANLKVQPPRQRSFQMQQMLSAFQLNLTALSMVSLLVGVFLIYTTISASVTRRRTEIGILRSLGSTRLEVRALFLGEAAFYGLVGIVLGGLGGIWLAQFLVGAVAKTISSLYLLVSIDRLHFTLWEWFWAAFFGLATVLVGAWLPASEAARINPVSALSLGTRAEREMSRAYRWHWAGIGLLLLSVVASWGALAKGPAALGFVAAFLVLAGFALFAPGATVGFGQAMAGIFSGRLLVRLAAENLRRSVHRTGITVAALSVAVAMMTGLTIMIFSFRTSVNDWVQRGVVADLFIAPASNETIGSGAFILPETVSWLRSQPGVESVDTSRELAVTIGSENALLSVIEGAYHDNMQFVGGNAAAKMARVFAGETVAVSESFARRMRVRDGSRITLATPVGQRDFEVGGVYSDYTRDQGVIFMARPLFDRFWNDSRVQNLAVYLKPGVPWEPVA
ncbi:MAG TPA: FtsX-like permease family protein, partial [Chthoniobacteraceae bacterium]